MKQKHTTRKERQFVRRVIGHQVQERELRQLPRRAALALLKMEEATSHRIDPVRLLSGEKEARR